MTPTLIILIDDNPITLFYNEDVVREVFSEVKIITYESSTTFLEDFLALKFSQEEILLFLDISMPVYSGFELLEEIEEEIDDLNKLSVIMLTSSKMKSDTEKATRFPIIISYIEKPVTKLKITDIFHNA
ncbi:MAG TPA: response regulator [Crocinitomix sp.]|nr:response regulator [Crocinitomix sp.]